MLKKTSISGRRGIKSIMTLLMSVTVALVMFATDVLAQDYDFSLRLRRMGDKIGAELWVRSLNSSAPKLGSFTYSVVYNSSYLQPAATTYDAGVTDSVDYNVNQAADLPYREIESSFDGTNGYSAIQVGNGSGYAELEITFTGNASSEGVQPGTTGRGTFVGRVLFDIINHASLSDSDQTGIITNQTGIPSIVIYDANENLLDNTTDITFTDPSAMNIRGITILNPNGPSEAVNRTSTYLSLSVAGYPVYFERSGLVNPSTYSYGTDGLAYAMDYSLDGGSNWTTNVMRFAETTAQATAATFDNLASGEIETSNGSVPGYTITKADGNPLTSSGDGYGGIVRVIWEDNQTFAYRSEEARLRIYQLESAGSGSDIDNRDRDDIYDISDFDFVLSSLFFVQLNGSDEYFRTTGNYSNATQLTVEAWLNLNEYGASSSEPGIVASSGGPASPEEGAWILYLEDGKYPAFRAREFDDRGTNGYIAELVSPYALDVANSDITLGSDAASETHRKNWTHVAATVANNVVTLYVDGQIVDQYTNTAAQDIRMKTFSHPIWIGVNPNISIDAEDYLKAGFKEVRVWRYALTQAEVLENAAGVYDIIGTTSAINPNPNGSDIRAAIEIDWPFQGARTDAASDVTFQNGLNTIDFYDGGSIDNTAINYRPDRAHITLVTPTGGEGISNIEDNTYDISWIGYGLGSTSPSSEDLMIEYSRDGGTSWANALDNTAAPAGLPLNEVEIEAGSATWEPYNSVTESGAYHDLQGVGNSIETNYVKQVYVRISGTSGNAQTDIYDMSGMVYVAPYFSLRNNGDAIVSIDGTTSLNLSTGVTFMEAWVRPYRFPTTTEGYFPIISKVDSTSGDVHYMLKLRSDGRLQFDITPSSGTVVSAYSAADSPLWEPNVEILDSVWFHVGVYVNLASGTGASAVRFYIDGVPQYVDSISTQYGSNVSVPVTNTYPAYIGYEPSNGVDNSKAFIGEMREVRFWNGYPAGMDISGTESIANPTDMTKFIQGALAIHADDLLTTPTNYQENLVAAFTFENGGYVSNGYQRTIASTNSNIKAYVRGDIGISTDGVAYVPTKPYLKLVEPVTRQAVANSETSLRLRWAGFDYDEAGFRSGSAALSQDADIEYSIRGGGDVIVQPWQAVASTNYAGAYTNALGLTATDEYNFAGVTSGIQYGAELNVSISDPDENDDGTYNDQGPIYSALTNARMALTGRATINSLTPFEYTDILTLRSEGNLFTVTPPSNFTVRMLLEGFHSGSDEDVTDIGESYEGLGIKIRLFNEIAGGPGTVVDSAESVYGYDSDASALNAGTAPVRGTDGSMFASVPFIFTSLADGDYYVVVEHLNHLPVMSRFTANYQFDGDDLDTWTIESGWDFQSWGQNATPTSSNYMSMSTDDIYSGNGLFSAYGQTELDEDEVGYDKTGLIFNQGQETATSNRMAALVAGDVYRDGQINSSDRIRVRDDASSNVNRSDVTGDGLVNAVDRDIVDRNFNKLSSLIDLTVVDYPTGQEVPMFPWVSDEKPLEHVSDLNPERAMAMNAAAKEFIENGSVQAAPVVMSSKKGDHTLAGFSYRVFAEPQLKDGKMFVTMSIENLGQEWAPGNCTFALKYDNRNLDFVGLTATDENLFSSDAAAGYSAAYSAPEENADNPVVNVRTIEIDYDGYSRPVGNNVPNSKTKLGTLVFDVTGSADEYEFSWHKLSVVLTTDGRNITGEGDFVTVEPVNVIRFASITVPNGGEEWRSGKLYTVTWTTPTVSQMVYVEYSTDNGATWGRIAEEPVDAMSAIYNWKTPSIRSTECLIRIVRVDDGTEVDRSDASFALLPAPAEITRPSAADPIYTGGANDFIRWNVDDPTNVRFEFSDNGESGWVPVTATVNSQTGEVDWVLPAVNTKNAVVRMINSETNEIMTQSQQFKVLAGGVTITSPRAGDVVNTGELKDVRWTYDNVSRFDLHLSFDGGETWVEMSREVNALPRNYEWTVPTYKNTKHAIIRALWNNDPDMEYSRTPEFEIAGPVSAEDLENLGYAFNRPVPNPFTDETRIEFTLPNTENVTITVFSSTGQQVAVLADSKSFDEGTHHVFFQANELPAGVYIVHLRAGTYSEVREAILVK